MENALHWAALDIPAPISRATYLASRAQFPVQLTDAERSLFLELIGRVDARDGQTEFWVRSENMAAAVGKSLRTIGTIMASLVTKGLIDKEQRRGRWGSFSSLTCKLTSLAVQLLGLDVRAQAGHATRKKTADAYLAIPNSFTKTTRVACKSRDDLPEDLRTLFDAGISLPGIFKLMKMATSKGRRLGQVIGQHAQSIAKARHPFAYVTKILGSAHQTCEPTEKAKEEVRDQKIRMQRKLVAGMTFLTPKGRIARFTSDGVLCQLWCQDEQGLKLEKTLGGSVLNDVLEKFSDSGWVEQHSKGIDRGQSCESRDSKDAMGRGTPCPVLQADLAVGSGLSVRIPLKPATDSNPTLPVIPVQTGPLFRPKPYLPLV